MLRIGGLVFQELQAGQSQSDIGSIVLALHFLGAILAVSLCALSLYAWMRRRNTSLIFVATAFFTFFILILMDEILPEGASTDLVSGVLQLVILSLFFFAVFGGLGRRSRKVDEEPVSPKADSTVSG